MAAAKGEKDDDTQTADYGCFEPSGTRQSALC